MSALARKTQRGVELASDSEKGQQAMKRVVIRLILALAITAIGAFAADPFVGTWKRNVAKSSATNEKVNAQTNVYEAIPNGFRMTRTSPGGAPVVNDYIFDGKEHALTQESGPRTATGADTRIAKRLSANAFEIKLFAKGKLVATRRTEVSKDGRTMTTTTDGVTTTGGKLKIVWVDEKQ